MLPRLLSRHLQCPAFRASRLHGPGQALERPGCGGTFRRAAPASRASGKIIAHAPLDVRSARHRGGAVDVVWRPDGVTGVVLALIGTAVDRRQLTVGNGDRGAGATRPS